MKRILLMCLFVIGISAVGLAQGGQQTPADKAARLKASLALTDDQTAKVTAIYTAHDKSMDSLKKGDNGDFGAMMKKMFPIIMATNDKIKTTLNADQAAKFQIQVDAQTEYLKKLMAGNNQQ